MQLAAHENVVVLKDECRRGAKGDTGGGTMLAIEVGSQSMVCPVIVEDLSSPGQMLIEVCSWSRIHSLEPRDGLENIPSIYASPVAE